MNSYAAARSHRTRPTCRPIYSRVYLPMHKPACFSFQFSFHFSLFMFYYHSSSHFFCHSSCVTFQLSDSPPPLVALSYKAEGIRSRGKEGGRGMKGEIGYQDSPKLLGESGIQDPKSRPWGRLPALRPPAARLAFARRQSRAQGRRCVICSCIVFQLSCLMSNIAFALSQFYSPLKKT